MLWCWNCPNIRFRINVRIQILIPMNSQWIPGSYFTGFAIRSLNPYIYMGKLYQSQRVLAALLHLLSQPLLAGTMIPSHGRAASTAVRRCIRHKPILLVRTLYSHAHNAAVTMIYDIWYIYIHIYIYIYIYIYTHTYTLESSGCPLGGLDSISWWKERMSSCWTRRHVFLLN